jgi:hypothetical protein
VEAGRLEAKCPGVWFCVAADSVAIGWWSARAARGSSMTDLTIKRSLDD